MPRLFLLLVLAASAASAQQQAPTIDPDVLARALDQPWSTVGPTLPPPDFGELDNGAGSLGWMSDDEAFDRLWFTIVDGTIETLIVQTLPDAELNGAEMDRQLRERVGEPDEDGFFRWSQLRDVVEYGYEGAPHQPVDLYVDVAQNRMVIRHAVDEP